MTNGSTNGPIAATILLTVAVLAATPSFACAAQPPAMRIGALEARHVFKLDDYYVWCPQVIAGEDGRYHLVYSRWPKTSGTGGWLRHSEIAIATGSSPEGPFVHEKVLLKGAGPGHWDELMAHNPKLYRFEARYYLYYISSRRGPTTGHVRDSQRTGVAVADDILGPYRRSAAPVVEPSPPVHNLTVNPTVARMPDGRYLMMLKGDRHPKTPEERMGQRVQGLAVADRPEGPFSIRPELAIADIDTEDAAIWYDADRACYFGVFHGHTFIGSIESEDGFRWRRSAPFHLIEGRQLPKADGGWLHSQRALQRPDVFVENGVPRVLSLALVEQDDWYVVTLPILPEERRAGP